MRAEPPRGLGSPSGEASLEFLIRAEPFLGLCFIGGIAVERARFDQERAARLKRYEEVTRRLRTEQMRLEQETEGASGSRRR